MVPVEIEYCVPCGLLDPAVDTQRELLDAFGRDLDAITAGVHDRIAAEAYTVGRND